MADTLGQAGVNLSGTKTYNTKDKKPKKQSEQTIMDLLITNRS